MSSYCNNRNRQSNKRFCNFYRHLGYSIETCYHHNKSVVSISIATVANIVSIQPMASICTKSESFGSTITISSVDLQKIITNTSAQITPFLLILNLLFNWFFIVSPSLYNKYYINLRYLITIHWAHNNAFIFCQKTFLLFLFITFLYYF